MPNPPPRQLFELRGRLPTRMRASLAAVDVVGLALILAQIGFWPHGSVLLVVGTVVVLLGVLGWLVAEIVLRRLRQQITLDAVGIHIGMPRPASIGWKEITAVRSDGRMLSLELRDRTRLLVNGSLYAKGFPELRTALLVRLRQQA